MTYLLITTTSPDGAVFSSLLAYMPQGATDAARREEQDQEAHAVLARHKRDGQVVRCRVRCDVGRPGGESFSEWEVQP